MAEYAFEPDEYVVLRAAEVHAEGNSTFSTFATNRYSEMILTNKNIIHARKGTFGKVKGYDVYPLADIRIIDGVPQCRLDTSSFMDEKLEVSFTNRLVSFVFWGTDAKKEVREWVNAINRILVGADAPDDKIRASGVGALTDGDELADAFGRIFGSFENARARKRAKEAPVVANRCPACDASVKGRVGETVTCPYCNSHITITLGGAQDV